MKKRKKPKLLEKSLKTEIKILTPTSTLDSPNPNLIIDDIGLIDSNSIL